MITDMIDAQLWGLNEQLPPETGLLAIESPDESSRRYRFADGTVCESPGCALQHLTDLILGREAW